MFLKKTCATVALILAACPLWAESAPAALTYDQFEVAVPHMDLETCPGSMAADGVFCRATFNHDEIHVFAFHEGGDVPFVGFETFPADGLSSLLK